MSDEKSTAFGYDSAFGSPPDKSDDDLFEDLFEGSDTHHLIRSLDSYTEKEQQAAIARFKIIRFVERRIKGGWTEKNLVPILAEAKCSLGMKIPCCRALSDWKKQYYESGRSIHSLVPQHRKKGNRNRHTDSQQYIDEAIEKKYLTRERLTVAETYQYYKDQVLLANRNIVDGKITLLKDRAFYDRIKELPPYDVALARYGKRYADRKFRSVGEMLPATYPLEYVEIDHTPAPVILIDDELDIAVGRPYLTILFDRYTKCIVGLSVNWREPSYDSVRKAFLNAVLKKDWLKERYPMVENDWPCFGKIEHLVVDNGAEFWSDSLEDALRPLVTDIDYCKTAHPWEKPGVENVFDLFNRGVNNKLPGKTFTNPEQLKDYNPKKDAVIRVSTFLSFIHKWIVDIYHQDSDSRERAIPYRKWDSSKWRPNFYEGKEEEQLRIELGLLRHRTIRLGGIHLHSIRYQSDELIDYRKYNADKLYVKTKTDPSDLSHIYVYLDQEARYIKVPAVDSTGYTKGLSLFEHQRSLRVQRLHTRSLVDEEALADARLYIDGRIDEEIEYFSQPKKGKRSLPKSGNVSKIAKFRDLGSDGRTTIVNQDRGLANISPPISSDSTVEEHIPPQDFTDIEGY
ncbi:Mu transposase C-terminal domain-containing protein [Enterovibrio norvegicus]|uniref:Mu transposase C-terminal domain-containing protein n=1 Tax=Enterovibrio norvegicus TaxID=188144 RepID=UPI00352C3C65